jgi:hypothetical protein
MTIANASKTEYDVVNVRNIFNAMKRGRKGGKESADNTIKEKQEEAIPHDGLARNRNVRTLEGTIPPWHYRTRH